METDSPFRTMQGIPHLEAIILLHTSFWCRGKMGRGDAVQRIPAFSPAQCFKPWSLQRGPRPDLQTRNKTRNVRVT